MATTHGGKRQNAGRPKGSGYLTEARKKLIDNADSIIDALITKAQQGDINALKLCIERLVPVAKDQPVFMNLKHINGDKIEQLEAIRTQVLKGELSIDEALEQATFLRTMNQEIRNATPLHKRSMFD